MSICACLRAIYKSISYYYDGIYMMPKMHIEQMEYLLDFVVTDHTLDHKYKTKLIQALTNRIADAHLNEYLHGTLYDEGWELDPDLASLYAQKGPK